MLRLGRREAYGEDDDLRDQDGVRAMGSRKHKEVSTVRAARWRYEVRTLRPMSSTMTRNASPVLQPPGTETRHAICGTKSQRCSGSTIRRTWPWRRAFRAIHMQGHDKAARLPFATPEPDEAAWPKYVVSVLRRSGPGYSRRCVQVRCALDAVLAELSRRVLNKADG